jgi:tRNA pseudouridine55 synthase
MTQALNGLLVLDKPAGITSRDTVDRALRWFGRRTKMGHTGTLDPFATGVLVLCLGSATRLTQYVQDMRKTYRGVFVLGATSDTDDVDGLLSPVAGAAAPGREAVAAALAALVGNIEQVPPAYSAAKVAGQRAYDLARQGEQVSLRPRAVRVYGIDLLRCDWPEVEVEVRCGKGTYIRSLARDLGQALGCGAHVRQLRRTQVGPFRADEALSLDADRETAQARLQPPGLALAELPRVVIDAGQARRLRGGQALALPPALAAQEGEVGVFDETGAVVAVVQIDTARRELRPVKVLA